MNEDFTDILSCLLDAGARFLIVGAHALAVHGVPRATGDLDIWIDASSGNADKVWTALVTFGAPVEDMGVTRGDLLRPAMVVQLGAAPRRIDVLTEVSGVTFQEAWPDRVMHTVGDLRLPFLGRAALIANKRAAGRLQDLADLEALGETAEGA